MDTVRIPPALLNWPKRRGRGRAERTQAGVLPGRPAPGRCVVRGRGAGARMRTGRRSARWQVSGLGVGGRWELPALLLLALCAASARGLFPIKRGRKALLHQSPTRPWSSVRRGEGGSGPELSPRRRRALAHQRPQDTPDGDLDPAVPVGVPGAAECGAGRTRRVVTALSVPQGNYRTQMWDKQKEVFLCPRPPAWACMWRVKDPEGKVGPSSLELFPGWTELAKTRSLHLARLE